MYILVSGNKKKKTLTQTKCMRNIPPNSAVETINTDRNVFILFSFAKHKKIILNRKLIIRDSIIFSKRYVMVPANIISRIYITAIMK